MPRITLSGRLTEFVGGRHRGEEAQCVIQISLRKEPSGKAPDADRYYGCGFYVSERDAIAFRPGQPIRITIEQD